jgi:8-oxo-dGTP diphosphatase
LSDYTPPLMAVSVDVAVFTVRKEGPHVVLIRRGNDPYKGAWALPGGFVELDEDLSVAAARELAEETGLEIPSTDLTQVRTYGQPDRDPRMRVVDVLFRVLVPDLADPVGGSDAAHSELVAIAMALSDDFELAFDHSVVLRDAVEAAGL